MADLTELLKKFAGWTGRFTGFSALVAALGLAWVFVDVGPEMAMGLAIYGGNTEPDMPVAAFPTLAFAGLMVTAAVLFAASFKWQGLSWVSALLGLVAIAIDVQFLLALLDGT